MGLYMGRGAALGLGKESTAGTPVARAVWLRPYEIRGAVSQESKPVRPHLVGPNDTSGGMRRAFAQGHQRFALSTTTELQYGDATMTLLYAALGAVAEGGGGGPTYTHTFTLGELPTHTIEVIRGIDSAAAARAEVFAGCAPRRAALSWDAEGDGTPGRAAIDWVAMSSAGDVAAGTPSYGALTTPSLFWHVGTIGWNSLTLTPRRMTLIIENDLRERFRLGSRTSAKYELASRAVFLEAELDWDENSLYPDYQGTDQGDLTVTVTNGSASLAITLQNAFLDQHGSDSAGPEEVRRAVRWQGLSDGTDLGLQVVATNANSVYSSNG